MKISIKTTARIGGILYLIIIFAGVFSEIFVRDKLIVAGNATATANNIIASQLLWRTGIASDLIMHICDVPLVLILYILLKPVNKYLALLAMLFTLIQTTVMVAFKLNLFMSLFLLSDADYLKALEPHQRHALAYTFIRSDAYGFSFGLLFFGFSCLLIGYLIINSGYLPKLIGVLMQIGGFCYITNSFAMILAPKFADMLFPAILAPVFFAEMTFCIWLIVKGVNIPKWNKQVNLGTG